MFVKFISIFIQLAFASSPHDFALVLRRITTGTTLLLVYVDDMVITGDNLEGIQQLNQSLSQQFEMKYLGFLNYFLGLEVSSNTNGYYLSQS